MTVETDPPVRQRDEEGDWHDLVPGDCPTCGCAIFHARDAAAIVWEPGPAWDPGCRSRSCRCHADPVVGASRSEA